MKKMLWMTLFCGLSLGPVWSQQPSPAQIDDRAQSILKKMTLEEKVDYIGGYNGFYVRAVPRLGLPAFKMSDGPVQLPADVKACTPESTNPSHEEITRTSLEAHQTLMAMSAENVARFKDVTQFLAEDLRSQLAAHTAEWEELMMQLEGA